MAEILHVESALELLGGETELLCALLRGFLEDRPFSRERLCTLSETDAAAAASYVHYYKGAARQLGAEELGEAGQQLEDVLRGRSPGSLPEREERFAAAYDRAVQAMRETLDILSAEGATP